MTAAWTLPERRLIAELAVGIARRLHRILGSREDVGPGYVHHIYTSEFEAGCSVLWRLGVAEPASPYGRTHDRIFPPFFKPIAPSEMREALAANPPGSPPSIHELLCAYLALACDYVEPQLSSRREPFVPAEEYLREVEALERTSYIARRGAAVLWTDKIARAMQEIYCWNANGRSIAEVSEVELAAMTTAAIEEMPGPVIRLLALEARRMSELELWAFVRKRFPELSWVRSPDGSPPYAGPRGLLKAVHRALRTWEG